jgi:nitroimidazol reductase NimA-like FMN-containing flavoprotein (pyridoxamine 5'-phosphate oxidase superfamily)
MFREMRRKDRELSLDEAKEILQSGKFGIMSVMGEDGYPYGVPLHYVTIEDKLYFHSTVAGGYKADRLKANPKISFTVLEPLEDMR